MATIGTFKARIDIFYNVLGKIKTLIVSYLNINVVKKQNRKRAFFPDIIRKYK